MFNYELSHRREGQAFLGVLTCVSLVVSFAFLLTFTDHSFLWLGALMVVAGCVSGVIGLVSLWHFATGVPEIDEEDEETWIRMKSPELIDGWYPQFVACRNEFWDDIINGSITGVLVGGTLYWCIYITNAFILA